MPYKFLEAICPVSQKDLFVISFEITLDVLIHLGENKHF